MTENTSHCPECTETLRRNYALCICGQVRAAERRVLDKALELVASLPWGDSEWMEYVECNPEHDTLTAIASLRPNGGTFVFAPVVVEERDGQVTRVITKARIYLS